MTSSWNIPLFCVSIRITFCKHHLRFHASCFIASTLLPFINLWLLLYQRISFLGLSMLGSLINPFTEFFFSCHVHELAVRKAAVKELKFQISPWISCLQWQSVPLQNGCELVHATFVTAPVVYIWATWKNIGPATRFLMAKRSECDSPSSLLSARTLLSLNSSCKNKPVKQINIQLLWPEPVAAIISFLILMCWTVCSS